MAFWGRDFDIREICLSKLSLPAVSRLAKKFGRVEACFRRRRSYLLRPARAFATSTHLRTASSHTGVVGDVHLMMPEKYGRSQLGVGGSLTFHDGSPHRSPSPHHYSPPHHSPQHRSPPHRSPPPAAARESPTRTCPSPIGSGELAHSSFRRLERRVRRRRSARTRGGAPGP